MGNVDQSLSLSQPIVETQSKGSYSIIFVHIYIMQYQIKQRKKMGLFMSSYYMNVKPIQIK